MRGMTSVRAKSMKSKPTELMSPSFASTEEESEMAEEDEA
jgi:hypothetical protein